MLALIKNHLPENQNKIEFVVHKDADGNDISLANLSVESAKALSVFLNSLTQIARLQVHTTNPKIMVTPGSACVSLVPHPDEFEEFESELNNVLDYSSPNGEVVKWYREMQKTIKANGLDYKVLVHKNGQSSNVLHRFKVNKNFRVSNVNAPVPTVKLEFSKGKMIDIGGKKPNFHIELAGGELMKINCSEEEAKRVNQLLYVEIFLCAWAVRKSGRKTEFDFCDFYTQEEVFENYKAFYELNSISTGTARFNQLHDKLVEVIDDGGLGHALKVMRMYLHRSVEIGKLRTILVTLKAFKEDESVKKTMETMADMLRDKTGKKLI